MTRGGELAPRVRALVLDVEGTTTPVSFVTDVLFPYARRCLRSYLAAHIGTADVNNPAIALGDEWDADIARDEPVPSRRPRGDDLQSLRDYLVWLMDRDRKSPGLKQIQGKIWESGYRDKELRSPMFGDVPSAFQRWSDLGLTIAIYSSGSMLAQRLLFAHSDSGDLTPSISNYFDTSSGPKRSSASYSRIAAALEVSTSEIAFISDVDAELEAAREAGCHVVMCVRPGNAATTSRVAPTVESFDEIDALLCLASRR